MVMRVLRPQHRGGRPGGRRGLVGDDLDASALLTLARRYVGRRVVVKRPLGAEPLAGPAPSGAIRGTTVRYDIYPPQR